MVSEEHTDMILQQLKKIQVYDLRGKVKQLMISPKTNYQKLLEGLDFDIIQQEM